MTETNSTSLSEDLAHAPVGRLAVWFTGARPRTLPAAVAPVLVGTALAARDGSFHPLSLVATLTAALFVQIGANFANDYSDAKRGADTPERLGPVRLTATGQASANSVLIAAWICFALAFAAGIYVAATTSWLLLGVGAAAIAAALLYTGGPKPYGYTGLGELFVFVFFGLVAVVGTYFAHTQTITQAAVFAAVPVGALASAILVVNNIRDFEGDRRAGKRTLAVLIGRSRAITLYRTLVATAYISVVILVAFRTFSPLALICWFSLVMALRPLRLVQTCEDGPSLNGALAQTGKLLLAFCILLALGVLILPVGE